MMKSLRNLNTIGIDLAKRIVQVCIINGRHQKPLVNKAIKAKNMLAYLANQPISIIAMVQYCEAVHLPTVLI